MRAAAAEAAAEVEEYRATRTARLHSHGATPEAAATAERLRRVAAETDAALAALDAEYARNKDLVIGMLLQIVLSVEHPFAATA